MNPLSREAGSAEHKPPSYEEFTVTGGPGHDHLLEIEDGLTSNQRSRGQRPPWADCLRDKLGVHLAVLWVVWFITFIIACCAMSKANANDYRIDNIDTSPMTDDGYDHWEERCANIGKALYGDKVFEYDGHHYQLVGGDWGKLTWRDAESDASGVSVKDSLRPEVPRWGRCYNGKPGYLATIQNPEENEYLRQQLVNSPGYQYGDTAWIGGTDMLSEGTFIWVDGYAAYEVFYARGRNVNAYSNFAPGEPNDAFDSEDCVSFNRDGYWNDDNCYKELQFFFVEFDA